MTHLRSLASFKSSARILALGCSGAGCGSGRPGLATSDMLELCLTHSADWVRYRVAATGQMCKRKQVVSIPVVKGEAVKTLIGAWRYAGTRINGANWDRGANPKGMIYYGPHGEMAV